jgi:hypothetical protein
LPSQPFQLIKMQYLTQLRYSLNPFLEPWTAAENHNGHNWTSVTRVGYVTVGHCKKIRSTYKETGFKSKFPQTLRHGILTDTMWIVIKCPKMQRQSPRFHVVNEQQSLRLSLDFRNVSFSWGLSMLLCSVLAASSSLHMILWRTSGGPIMLQYLSVHGLMRVLLSGFLYAVRFQGKTVAVISPTTLICHGSSV